MNCSDFLCLVMRLSEVRVLLLMTKPNGVQLKKF